MEIEREIESDIEREGEREREKERARETDRERERACVDFKESEVVLLYSKVRRGGSCGGACARGKRKHAQEESASTFTRR